MLIRPEREIVSYQKPETLSEKMITGFFESKGARRIVIMIWASRASKKLARYISPISGGDHRKGPLGWSMFQIFLAVKFTAIRFPGHLGTGER